MAPTSRHLLFFIAYALCSIHVAVPKGEPQDEPKGKHSVSLREN